MIVFFLVLAGLVLLALVGERLATRFWIRAQPRGPLVYCPRCAARHPVTRMASAAGVDHCPRGHAIPAPSQPRHSRTGTAAIFVLAAVVACGAILLAVGVIGVP